MSPLRQVLLRDSQRGRGRCVRNQPWHVLWEASTVSWTDIPLLGGEGGGLGVGRTVGGRDNARRGRRVERRRKVTRCWWMWTILALWPPRLESGDLIHPLEQRLDMGSMKWFWLGVFLLLPIRRKECLPQMDYCSAVVLSMFVILS